MKFVKTAITLLAITTFAPALADPPMYDDGVIFSNAENSYFAGEELREQPDLVFLRFENGAMQAVDAFGEPTTMPETFTIIAHDDTEIIADINGVRTQLRRAREVQCWGAVKREGELAEGEDPWVFNQALVLHDQGGRAQVGDGTNGAPAATIRIRRVTWAAGSSNRPSLVIYAHETRDDMSAVSYAWADGGASRVGLNLRWMQASCTIVGAERPSAVERDNFRG